jgi:hypothetical protein
MRPILLDFGFSLPLLGPVNFPAYFTLLTISFAIGMWMTKREAPRLGMDPERVLDLEPVAGAVGGDRRAPACT